MLRRSGRSEGADKAFRKSGHRDAARYLVSCPGGDAGDAQGDDERGNVQIGNRDTVDEAEGQADAKATRHGEGDRSREVDTVCRQHDQYGGRDDAG
uniref:hypothetical protein n=1 Tax=Rhizobium sp. RCAM05350 TaxID=2895568 RepID=UPI0020766D18|nr:hypothetical protein [Rhizobium sp. RCAM05350]